LGEGLQKVSLSLKIWNTLCCTVNNLCEALAPFCAERCSSSGDLAMYSLSSCKRSDVSRRNASLTPARRTAGCQKIVRQIRFCWMEPLANFYLLSPILGLGAKSFFI
jgi:hypothetical protein